MNWLGRSRVAYHASPTPITLSQKAGKPDIPLTDLCKSIVPPCNLSPLLWNGHLQTAWTTLAKDRIPDIFYKRKVFEAEGKHFAGSFSVDFVVAEGGEVDASLPERTSYFKKDEDVSSLDETPMVIVLHGMSGGSSEAYVRDVLASLTKGGEWAGCVLLSRGCAKSKITSRLLYNGRSTWDLRQLVKWLRLQYPNRPLFGLGFSLGANILTNVSLICPMHELELNSWHLVSWRRG